jgi:glutamate-ammonia-ligase adenylyltransferase
MTGKGGPTPDPAALLGDPPAPRALAHLRSLGFVDPTRAAHELRLLAARDEVRGRLEAILPDLLWAFSRVPDPDAAVGRLERLVRAGEEGVALLASLRERGPLGVSALSWALGASPFLAEELVRNPGWADGATDPHVLARPRRRAALDRRLADALARSAKEAPESWDALRRARRQEIVLVAIRDLLRIAPVEETLEALSTLADALVSASLELAVDEVRAEMGLAPRRPGSHGPSPGFVVLALGKLGGSELNFSSDVDLVYLHRSDAGTVSRGAGAPGRHVYAAALARRLTSVLGDTTSAGHVYRVDLRLRPEGRAGALVHSLSAAEAYYQARGATWERLALLKARPVAGDARTAEDLTRRVFPFVWQRPFDDAALHQVLRMKHESDHRLAVRGLSDRHVKLGRGGIREIELVTQVLQIRHGDRAALRDPRARTTLVALPALAAAGALSPGDAEALGRAYVFLRDVENKLQMVHDAQTHILPEDEIEQRRLACRLGYGSPLAASGAAVFRSELRAHTATVHRLFGEILGHLQR